MLINLIKTQIMIRKFPIYYNHLSCRKTEHFFFTFNLAYNMAFVAQWTGVDHMEFLFIFNFVAVSQYIISMLVTFIHLIFIQNMLFNLGPINQIFAANHVYRPKP
jgi:hypothetical protein